MPLLQCRLRRGACISKQAVYRIPSYTQIIPSVTVMPLAATVRRRTCKGLSSMCVHPLLLATHYYRTYSCKNGQHASATSAVLCRSDRVIASTLLVVESAELVRHLTIVERADHIAVCQPPEGIPLVSRNSMALKIHRHRSIRGCCTLCWST